MVVSDICGLNNDRAGWVAKGNQRGWGHPMPASVKWRKDSRAVAPGPPSTTTTSTPGPTAGPPAYRTSSPPAPSATGQRAPGFLPRQTGADRTTTAGLRYARRFGQRRRLAAAPLAAPVVELVKSRVSTSSTTSDAQTQTSAQAPKLLVELPPNPHPLEAICGTEPPRLETTKRGSCGKADQRGWRRNS